MLLDYCPKTLLDMMQASNFNLDSFFIYEVGTLSWNQTAQNVWSEEGTGSGMEIDLF